MPWHAIKFPNDLAIYAEPNPLLRELQSLYEQAKRPKGFAVFQETKDDGTLFLYFSPETETLCRLVLRSFQAKVYEPVQSDKPIILMVGDLSVQWPLP